MTVLTRSTETCFALTMSRTPEYPRFRVMNRSLNRYYYYYGPLSSGRDGLALGCRGATQ